jgi:hypothetical protein
LFLSLGGTGRLKLAIAQHPKKPQNALAAVEAADYAPLATVEAADYVPLATVEAADYAPLATVEAADSAPFSTVFAALLSSYIDSGTGSD